MLSFELVDDAASLAGSLAVAARPRRGPRLRRALPHRPPRLRVREAAPRGPRRFARSPSNAPAPAPSATARPRPRAGAPSAARPPSAIAPPQRARQRVGHAPGRGARDGRFRRRQDHRARRLRRGSRRCPASSARAGAALRRLDHRQRRPLRLLLASSCARPSRCATPPLRSCRRRSPRSATPTVAPRARRRCRDVAGLGEYPLPVDTMEQLLDAVAERYGQGPRADAPRATSSRCASASPPTSPAPRPPPPASSAWCSACSSPTSPASARCSCSSTRSSRPTRRAERWSPSSSAARPRGSC